MSNINLKEELHNYFMLYADCFLTKGYTRTMLYDVTKKRAFFIDNAYYDVIKDLEKRTLKEVTESIRKEDRKEFYDFINQMVENNFGVIIDQPEYFPRIPQEWDSPHEITNAIIDIRDSAHNYSDIFEQLDSLLCPFIQLRSYVELKPKEITEILKSYDRLYEFTHIEIILKFSKNLMVDEFLDLLKRFKMISLVFHSVGDKSLVDDLNDISSRMSFIKQAFNSCDNCGIINKSTMRFPEMREYMENTLYNNCLNRKISIDEDGEIKNCPSMKNSFGKVNERTLKSVLHNKDFTEVWKINKEQIQVCRDCEYRHVCSDCRAYVSDSSNIYSKPLKCGYDPYSGVWEN